MKANAVPGQISALYQHLQPAVARSGSKIDRAIDANVRIQVELLPTSSAVIRDAISAGELKVEAAVYDVATGKVTVS
jgi:carbonic anhydrase